MIYVIGARHLTTRIRFFDPIPRHDPDITAAWH